MSDAGDAGEGGQRGRGDQKPTGRRITFTRIIIWVVVGGFAIYLIVTGIVGILAKAQ